jgi:hypothetical protein
MSTTRSAELDYLIALKTRELQRAWLAERAMPPKDAHKHYLGGAVLELLLADEYSQAGEVRLARRSKISAATCYWRAGLQSYANEVLEDLRRDDPLRSAEVDDIRQRLEHGPRDED